MIGPCEQLEKDASAAATAGTEMLIRTCDVTLLRGAISEQVSLRPTVDDKQQVVQIHRMTVVGIAEAH
jgi:hypothetical protein